jgi:PAS domain S-box-containing protein
MRVAFRHTICAGCGMTGDLRHAGWVTVVAPMRARPEGCRLKDRRQSPPVEPLGHIDRLPARVLLDRLPMPILAVHKDTVVYANPAFETMLGHPVGSLGGTAAARLVDEDTRSEGSVGSTLRRRSGELLGLRHSEGSLIKVVVSQPMLLRADEQVVLIGVQDVTEHIWESAEEP